MIGRMAVCSYHGPPHAHRNADPMHPNHLPKIPVRSDLDYAETVRLIRALCRHLRREPTPKELEEALR